MKESLGELFAKVTAQVYYTNLAWFLCAILALIIAILHYPKSQVARIFIYYLFSNVFLVNIISVLIFYIFQFDGTTDKYFTEIENTIFSAVEALTFFRFFSGATKQSNNKRFIRIARIGLLIIYLLFLYKIFDPASNAKSITALSVQINIIEFIVLLALCLSYYYHLLSDDKKPSHSLRDDASFWITSGLFFYCFISLPFLIIGEALIRIHNSLHNTFFSLHYVTLSVLMLCISKGILCKPTSTT